MKRRVRREREREEWKQDDRERGVCVSLLWACVRRARWMKEWTSDDVATGECDRLSLLSRDVTDYTSVIIVFTNLHCYGIQNIILNKNVTIY